MLAKSARSSRGGPMNLCASSPPSISAAAAAAAAALWFSFCCCCCTSKLKHLLTADGEPGSEPVGE
uniref:Uncharacterized protein n=1 Tax=Arundo donax TaxID=35708 RepID=A0A0A9CIU4_ARUDO